MTFFYGISMHIFYLAILTASVFNPKAALWIRGRWGWRKKLRQLHLSEKPVIWFHAASLGEFEQGRPLMEEIKKHSSYTILLTFYSPSGYEIRKHFPGADHVMYLPLDTGYNAARFVSLVKPKITVFIKYEFWYYYLRELHRGQHPVYLISAIFRPDQVFFRKSGYWFRSKLRFIDFFFVQDQASVSLLSSLGITRCKVSGDTRFDRVSSIAAAATEIEMAERFAAGSFCIVAGSTWPADEEILIRFIREKGQQMKWIIAPHEITDEHIRKLASSLNQKVALYSRTTPDEAADAGVLIIDNIGMLSSLYRYGQAAYIGGGFGRGIHNTLEAAAFGIPLIFGPNYGKFREAVDLIREGGAFSVKNYAELADIIVRLHRDEPYYRKAAAKTSAYVGDNTGATQTILDFLKHEAKISLTTQGNE